MQRSLRHAALLFWRALRLRVPTAVLIWAGVSLAILVVTWPSPPWDGLLCGGAAMMVIAPFLLYPFAKTLFPEDFSGA